MEPADIDESLRRCSRGRRSVEGGEDDRGDVALVGDETGVGAEFDRLVVGLRERELAGRMRAKILESLTRDRREWGDFALGDVGDGEDASDEGDGMEVLLEAEESMRVRTGLEEVEIGVVVDMVKALGIIVEYVTCFDLDSKSELFCACNRLMSASDVAV